LRTSRIPVAAALAAALLLLTACAPGAGTTASAPPASASPHASVTPAEPVTITIASLNGPTTMGLVKLMDDAKAGTAAENYVPTMYGSPDEVVPLIAQGKVDVALIPSNLAAVLYNKTKGTDAEIQVVAANTLGVLDLVESGDTIKSVADLKGRTIYISGKGASPEYILNYVLAKNGLTPGTNVTVEYLSEHTEVAARVAAEPGAIAVLPQPLVTVVETKNPAVRTALSLTDEWATASNGSPLVMGVVVVRKAFAEENPAAFATFLTDYQASTAFTNAHPAEAAPLIVAAGIAPSDAVAEAAIPESNIVYLAGPELRQALGGFLDVLFAANPKSVGGSVPGDDFYFGG